MSLFGLETTVKKTGKKSLKLNMCISVKLINGSTTRMLWQIFPRCHTGPLLISKVLLVSRELRYRSYFESIEITEELLSTSQQILEKGFIKKKIPSKHLLVQIYKQQQKKKDTRKKCKVCSKSTMKTTEQRRSGVFIVDFEHILHLFLVSILWTLSK